MLRSYRNHVKILTLRTSGSYVRTYSDLTYFGITGNEELDRIGATEPDCKKANVTGASTGISHSGQGTGRRDVLSTFGN